MKGDGARWLAPMRGLEVERPIPQFLGCAAVQSRGYSCATGAGHLGVIAILHQSCIRPTKRHFAHRKGL